MSFKDMTHDEQIVAQIVLDVVPEWKTILLQQIECADVSREDLYSMYVIKFSNIPESVARIPNSRNVPFQVFILPGEYEKREITYSYDGVVSFSDEANPQGRDAIGLAVFFENGVLFEIEASIFGLGKVDFSGIERGQICYYIQDRRLLDGIS